MLDKKKFIVTAVQTPRGKDRNYKDKDEKRRQWKQLRTDNHTHERQQRQKQNRTRTEHEKIQTRVMTTSYYARQNMTEANTPEKTR